MNYLSMFHGKEEKRKFSPFVTDVVILLRSFLFRRMQR